MPLPCVLYGLRALLRRVLENLVHAGHGLALVFHHLLHGQSLATGTPCSVLFLTRAVLANTQARREACPHNYLRHHSMGTGRPVQAAGIAVRPVRLCAWTLAILHATMQDACLRRAPDSLFRLCSTHAKTTWEDPGRDI